MILMFFNKQDISQNIMVIHVHAHANFSKQQRKYR